MPDAMFQNPFLNPRPKRLTSATITGSIQPTVKIFDNRTLAVGDVTGEYVDNEESIVYSALSAARPMASGPHGILVTNNPSLSTIGMEGWTWYFGDHPTGSGGHGTGTGVGRIEFIINQIQSPLNSMDWFIHVTGHKPNPKPGELWVRRNKSANDGDVPLGYFVTVDATSISPPAPIASSRAVDDFVAAVLRQVDDLSL